MRASVFLLLVAATAAADDWQLELVRDGWQPRVAKAVLILEKNGKRWKGAITFQRILYAQRHVLTGVSVRGKRVAFAVEHPKFTLRFEGRRTKDALEGTCAWEGSGRFPWTATAGDRRAVVRIDKGLRPRDLPTAPPDGLDAAALDRLVRAAEDAHTTSLVVLKDGRIVCERHFATPGRPQRIHTMSVTKWLTAMAAALLVEEKKIESLDAPLSTWFDEWGEGRKARVTLRHLLAHTSGIEDPGDARALNRQPDKIAYVRALPVVAEPGTAFAYSNNAVALLSGVLQAAADKPVDAYVDERVFRPLGIRDWTWDRDKAGRTLAYANLQLTARDLAKIGLLIAQRGRDAVFPARWIETLATPGKLQPRCGLLWWNHAGGKALYHTGFLGQWLVVFPQENLVGVRLRRFDGREADAAREMGNFLALLEATLR